MLITCPECGHTISDRAVTCPSCGFPLAPAQPLLPPSSCKRTRTKKKHKKLPNGFGTIKKLSGNRKNPYAAYPPTKEFNLNGSPVTVPAIGYYSNWYSAYESLVEYNRHPYDLSSNDITFEQLYNLYYKTKYEEGKKKFSDSSKRSTIAAFKNCSILHSRRFKELRKGDLQSVIDTCLLKHSSLELIVNLFKGMYKYALENDIVEKDYSAFVQINIPDDDESGEPFTQDELDILWENKDFPNVDSILIMIYSGFRIAAYSKMEYHLNENERFFKGGVKTNSSKNRIVPIHPAIYEFTKNIQNSPLLLSTVHYRKQFFYPTLQSLGIECTASGKKHTPHDCRHTFSWLCDKYQVNDISKHMLMGHSLGNDIEKTIYSHRTIEELRTEIEKIKV